MAPVLTVPAVPTTQKGWKPARRSAAMAFLSALQVHLIVLVDRDQVQRFAAQPKDIRRAFDAAMHFAGGVQHHPLGRRLHAL